MRVNVLGPVAVATTGDLVRIDTPKHRALLATLALRPGQIVPTAELVDALWGADPPPTAVKTLQTYVSALRAQFGDDLIETVPGGYRLAEVVDHVDAIEFRDAVLQGRTSLDQGNPHAARRSFARALSLWHGPPLGDLAPGSARDGQVVRFDELRLLALEGAVEAELALGHHREVVPDLEQLVAEHPYREVLWRALMLALYRSGRQADALAAYRRLRVRLADELGIEPADETQRLETQILGHDVGLELPAPVPTNLPVRLDSFVDREHERASVGAALDDHRLVTILGIGGVGKSRLANEIGRAMLPDAPGGVWWVDLAAIPAARSVLAHVAAAMQLPAATGDELERVLAARLQTEPAVVVLDNCEHVVDQVADFVRWATARVSHLRVLATSRVPLGVAGGHEVHLGPLAVEPVDEHAISDASRLFLDRAAPHVGSIAIDVGEIESLTDLVGGLPLGLELAAAQSSLRTPTELLSALAERGAVLELAGRSARHSSLGHVLDSTFEALDSNVAALAPRLAVFPGDFDVAAAAAVLGLAPPDGDAVVAQLIAASLLTPATTEAPQRRFRVLWPVREHLLASLTDDDRRDAESRHAEHFRAVARRYLDEANTPGEAHWVDQSWFDDHNLRIALTWTERHDPAGALVFGPGLGRAWQEHGDQLEGRTMLRRLLDEAPDARPELVAWTEAGLCWLEFLSGDAAAALAHLTDAIERFEEMGDARGLSRALGDQAHAFHLAGFETSITAPIYERSIEVARAAGLEFAAARAAVMFAHALTADEVLDRVDVDAMLTDAEDVLRRHRDHANLAHAALSRAFMAYSTGDERSKRVVDEEMLRQARLARSVVWEQIAHVTLGLGCDAAGDLDGAREHFRAAVRIAHDTVNRAQLGIALHALAAAIAHRAPESAARLWGAAGSMTPIWPLHARRYGEMLAPARDALGERFDALVAEGAGLSIDAATALAESVL